MSHWTPQHHLMMNLLVPHLPVNCIRSTLFPRHHTHVLLCTRNLITTQLTPEVSFMKMDCISLSFVSSFGSLQHKVFHASLHTGENSRCTQLSNDESSTNMYGEPILAEQVHVNGNSKLLRLIDKIDCQDDKEMQRRRKIGLANKGKVPWNKGKKHSAETCEKIKQNTKEAMSDPKVRKKISECPRSRSEQTKEKIGSSIRKLWGKRLQWKRSRDKFFQSWTETIALAAKIGGSDQKQLEWNSYDMMEREIALQRLLWAEEKDKAKEFSRMKRSQAKAEKMEMLALKRKERDEKRKKEKMEMLAPKREERDKNRKFRKRKKSKKRKEQVDAVHGVKLKAMITKVHKKKTTIGQHNVQRPLAWENFDLEVVRREMLQKEVSLADQIRVAKNKREGCISPKILSPSSLPEVVVHE